MTENKHKFLAWLSINWKYLIVAIPGIAGAIIAVIALGLQREQIKQENTAGPNMHFNIDNFVILPPEIVSDLSSIRDASSFGKGFQFALEVLMTTEPFVKELDKKSIEKLISTIENLYTRLDKEYEDKIIPYLKPLTLKVVFSNLGKASYLVENILVMQKGYPLELESYVGSKRYLSEHFSENPQDITARLHFSRRAPFLVPSDQDISILIEFPEPYTRWFIKEQVRSQGYRYVPSKETPQNVNAKAIELFRASLDILLERYSYEIRAELSNGLTISRSINVKDSLSERNSVQFLNK